MTADTRGKPAPASVPAVLWGEALPPHSLENVGPNELHVVSVEIKDAVMVAEPPRPNP